MSYVKKIQKGSTENWNTFVLWIISISLEPFMFYFPSIDDEKKLFKLNSSFMIIFGVLYFFLQFSRSKIPLSRSIESLCENKRYMKNLNRAESVASILSTVLLYSLVLIPEMKIRAPVFLVLLSIFLLAFLARIIGIYKLLTEEVIRSSPIIKIALNLLFFLFGGHLFGGLWYFFAIWKKLECWRNACLELYDHQICHYANNRFNVNPEGNKLLNDKCFAKIEDTKPYELGIFKDAFESLIVEETSELWRKEFWRKLLYCFRWGVQNISGFGQNLEVSTYAWENIFVVLIAIYGVGTFTFFIGNMQNLIKSAIDERTEDKRKKEHQANKLRQQQLRQCVLFGKLSENMKNIIKECQQYSVVDVENLFSILPKDVENTKRELFLELIKKVERFQRWSDTSLLHLCDCVKPVVYDERTHIVREGDPINEMLFVLHGKLWNFSSTASSTNNVPPHDRRKEFLKDGDFWGEEIVNWVQDESSSIVNWVQDESSSSSSSNKLISQTTIQALTKVEAFVLRVDDLKKLFNENAKILQSWFRKRKKGDLWMELLTAIRSKRGQTPPGDQLTGPEIVVV